LNFSVKKGEIYGFLGPNGAGKTTTIRHLLGFSKPDKGNTSIDGMDSWLKPRIIQEKLGYIPGEMALPDNMTGGKFIQMIAELRGLKDMTYANELIKRFGLDVKANLKRMSKGTKQKVGIVVAFMHDPEILLLDEPSSGLDPLMQAEFIDLVREEKSKGKTILLSSHMFDEVEKTCDRVSIIKQGKIVTTINVKDIEHRNKKTYEIKFASLEELKKFKALKFDLIEYNEEKSRVKLEVCDKDINLLINSLTNYKVVYISEIKYTLEDYFMNFYRGKNK
jgi:ABC-2 type transport system ATP-binding protein